MTTNAQNLRPTFITGGWGLAQDNQQEHRLLLVPMVNGLVEEDLFNISIFRPSSFVGGALFHF
jgi:hypothetical protein